MARLERIAFWTAIVCAALGFTTSAGCQALPSYPSSWVAWLHPLVLLAGIAAGWAVVLRSEEIDRRRWEIVEDPLLTSGERDWAHKDAERKRRFASTFFIAAPLMLGYWLAHQAAESGRMVFAHLLTVSALVGAVAGMILARRRQR